MNAVLPHLPALQVIVPLFGAILAAFLRRGLPGFLIALVATWTAAVIAALLLWQALTSGPISYELGGWAPPWGIEYRVDAFSGFVLLLVSAVTAVTMPFAYRSIPSELGGERPAWFYCMYLLCLAGLLGVTITGDAFNAFVFLEITSLSTYVLIASGQDRRAILASFQYLIMGTIGATFYVIGVAFLYILTGSLNMVDIAGRLGPAAADQMPAVVAAMAFIMVGVSLKLALFPLHVWLPNAYAYAPSWVTTFLAATATKVAAYLLMRYFFSVFGVAIDLDALPVTEFIIGLSIVAMFFASFVAVFQIDLKRMLAYSSVAQVGYITLGIGIANQAALTGSIVHLANHALMKAALFLSLGAVFYRIRSVKLHDLSGIGPHMPLTMATFVVAGFAIIGVPGTTGFITKWYLAVGALDYGWPLILLIVAASLIAVLYNARDVEEAWFRPPSPLAAKATDPPLSMLLPILVLGIVNIWFGIDTQWTAGFSGQAAALLLGGLK